MRPFLVKTASSIKGRIVLPGDKSIAHRAIILSALAPNKTLIQNFPLNKDCISTLDSFCKLGIKIISRSGSRRNSSAEVSISGKGLHGLKQPKGAIFVGESGTTLRLILGVLSGQNFQVKLTAGKSLSQRPMLRVTKPLRLMGAKIKSKVSRQSRDPDKSGKSQKSQLEEYPPITISGRNLKSIIYKMPVASAQVKSAVLLAGLYARGKTQVTEPIKTRDHTERMLKLFKAGVKIFRNKITIKGGRELTSPLKIYIPGDISSASFFMVLASILPHSHLFIGNVSLNPSRIGVIKVLRRMGASIKITNYQLPITNYEPMGDIIVKSSRLKGAIVKKEEVPSLIDELPILMVAASVAGGITVLEGVEELRVKETDRIRAMWDNLSRMGVDIGITKAGRSENIIIRGAKQLTAAKVRSFGDHRTAMSMVVAGLCAKGSTYIDDVSCINKSFPEFLTLLRPLIKYS